MIVKIFNFKKGIGIKSEKTMEKSQKSKGLETNERIEIS